jgi:hypothetical protein
MTRFWLAILALLVMGPAAPTFGQPISREYQL